MHILGVRILERKGMSTKLFTGSTIRAWLSAVTILFALHTPSEAQEASMVVPPSAPPFQLILKQADFTSFSVSTIFSDDERYFALIGDKSIDVYDLEAAVKVRSILTKDSFNTPVAYHLESRQNKLFIKDATSTHVCRLDLADDCSILGALEVSALPSTYKWSAAKDLSHYGWPKHFAGGTLPFNTPLNIWEGPLKQTTVYTQRADTGQLILFVKHAPTHRMETSPAVLGGTNTSMRRIRFIPGTDVLESQGYAAAEVFEANNAYYWVFPTGVVGTDQHKSAYSGDLRTVYFFYPTDAAGTMTLFRQTVPQQPQATKLSLQRMPSWFATWPSGEGVVVFDGSAIRAFDGTTTKALPCGQVSRPTLPGEAPNYIADNQWAHPAMSETGTALTAFCNFTRDHHESHYLVVWTPPGLAEQARIPADGFTNWSSMAVDGSMAVLGGDTRLRLVDIQNKSFQDIPLPDSLRKNETIRAGELQADNRTLVLTVDGSSSSGNDRIVWFDIVTRHQIRERASVGAITALATNRRGAVAIVDSSGTAEVFNSQATRFARLVAIGTTDWMVLSESGLFDGTPGAFRWLAFQSATGGRPIPAERLFNELYTPGLMQRLGSGQDVSLPPGLQLPTFLELPATRTLLRQGLTPRVLDGKAVVCFDVREMFTSKQAQQDGTTLIEDDVPGCGRRMVLTDQSTPALTVKGLSQLKERRITTPWDSDRLLTAPRRIHILPVAISKYSQAGIPDVPTAVPSVKGLAGRFATGSNVTLWGASNCGVDLFDNSATKKNILACMEKLISDVEADDMVILIFAGHGGTARTGPTRDEIFEFIAHADTLQSADSAISSAEFAEELRKLKASRVVLVMDSCESGALMSPLEGVIASNIQQSLALTTPNANGGDTVPSQGVLLVAAASGFESAVSTAKTNLFMDKFASLLLPSSRDGAWAHAVAEAMRSPIIQTDEDGSTSTMTPVSVVIGADFNLLQHQ